MSRVSPSRRVLPDKVGDTRTEAGIRDKGLAETGRSASQVGLI